jgi:hypothetical protein
MPAHPGVWAMKRFLTVERCRLVPAYLLNTSPMAWECAACGKLFWLRVEEAAGLNELCAPRQIEQEFNCHGCELHLGAQI